MTKRLAAEFLGTFFIVFAPVAWSMKGSTGLMGASLVSGLVVMAMISAFGPISAAHFNPAVTLGFALARRFSWKSVISYWVAQFGGAILAALVCSNVFEPGLGVHIPSNPGAVAQNLTMEFMITGILMLVIIAVATDRRVGPALPPLAIGLTVVLGVLLAGDVTGGSMNPARSLGPALFGPEIARTQLWIYFVGPITGAAFGALAYERIRLHPDEACSAPE